MANEEQLAILRQGVDVWNKWRASKLDDILILFGEEEIFKADLRNADLRDMDLHNVDFSNVDLSEAQLDRANLQNANLVEANLIGASLWATDLSKANLTRASLHASIFWGASLRDAILIEADLQQAELSDADLRGANFRNANLTRTIINAIIDSAILTCAKIGFTYFAATDLSNVRGLDDILHLAPSTIGIDTIQLSQGNIPDVFLRGCGLSDWEIEAIKLYNPELHNDEITRIQYNIHDLRAGKPLQLIPLFISYSHADKRFVDKVGSELSQMGIRYWRDIHDLKAGRMEKQIDRAIIQNPTVLLILSKNSLNSDWVEHEVRMARKLEKQNKRDVLCPISLDDSWKNSPWPAHIMEQILEYNILDFSEWEDESKFDVVFRKFIDGLALFYKG